MRRIQRVRRKRNGVGHLSATQKKSSYAKRNARRAMQKKSRRVNAKKAAA